MVTSHKAKVVDIKSGPISLFGSMLISLLKVDVSKKSRTSDSLGKYENGWLFHFQPSSLIRIMALCTEDIIPNKDNEQIKPE